MKNLALIISSMVVLTCFSLSAKGLSPALNAITTDSIHVWSSPDLSGMSTTWVESYSKIHPGTKIDIISASTERIYLALQNSGNIALVSKEYFPALDAQQNWSMIVGRNVIVPVMNPENPFLSQIQQHGISVAAFSAVFTNPHKQNWGTLLNNSEPSFVKCYLVNEESAKTFLKDFVKTDKKEISGIELVDEDQLMLKIKNDKFSIGFCKLSAILDKNSKEFIQSISIIPIDVNGNQKIDVFENIYSNAGDFTKGLWIGKYPKELYSRIYAVANVLPSQKAELDFLNWILTDGQSFLNNSGLAEITLVEQQRRLQNLYAGQNQISEAKPYVSVVMVFIFLIALGFAVLIIFYSFVSFRKNRMAPIETNTNNINTVFGEHMVEALSGLFFDKTHTWTFMEKNGGIRIGIDDFLQHVTGSITKIKLKNPGEYVKKGEPFITLIQQGKQLEINAPISGIIKEYNSELQTKASLINISPYGEGWIYVIESENWLKEIKSFLMGDSYKIWIKYEFVRLKTFLAIAINSRQTLQNQLVLQDGGELKDNILESFGPEIWEEFQVQFINHK